MQSIISYIGGVISLVNCFGSDDIMKYILVL